MIRQLSAIMFADMVGYTALMQTDERKAKAQRDRQRQVLEARVAEYEGKILQY
jgi:class 3 adenylate cyclase